MNRQVSISTGNRNLSHREDFPLRCSHGPRALVRILPAGDRVGVGGGEEGKWGRA